MVIEYSRKSSLSTILHVIDINHSLHKCKRELNVVRHRHVVLSIINVFPKCGATIGPITWTVFISLALST